METNSVGMWQARDYEIRLKLDAQFHATVDNDSTNGAYPVGRGSYPSLPMAQAACQAHEDARTNKKGPTE